MIQDVKVFFLTVQVDDRGYLIEIARRDNDPEPHGVVHHRLWPHTSRRGISVKRHDLSTCVMIHKRGKKKHEGGYTYS